MWGIKINHEIKGSRFWTTRIQWKVSDFFCGPYDGGNSNIFHVHPYLGRWSNLTNESLQDPEISPQNEFRWYTPNISKFRCMKSSTQKVAETLLLFFKDHLHGMRFERDHGEEQRLLARTIHGNSIQERWREPRTSGGLSTLVGTTHPPKMTCVVGYNSIPEVQWETCEGVTQWCWWEKNTFLSR